MNILHISTDEKFINSASWQFEHAARGKNKFIILVENINDPLKHVKNAKNIFVKDKSKETLHYLKRLVLQYDLICLHGLDYFRSKIVLNSPSRIKFIWFLWGSEIYNNPAITQQNEVLGKRTKLHFHKKSLLQSYKEHFKALSIRILFKLIHNSADPHRNIKLAIEKVRYCGILYDEEYQLVQRRTNSIAQFFKFCYYPIEFILSGVEHYEVNGNDILLGNSSFQTNNHLDIFELLAELNIESRKLITPLSYGDIKYGKEVQKIGERLFPDNFYPLTDFMNLKDYNQTIRKCGIVIMGQYRQQAVGNVLITLWMGAKVYLSEKNSLFQYLKRLGILIYSIEKDFSPSNEAVFKNLRKEQIVENRRILKAEIGIDHLLSSLKSQLEQLKKCP